MAVELAPFDPQWLAAEDQMGGRMVLGTESAVDSRARFAGIFAGIAPFIPGPTGAVTEEEIHINSTIRIKVYKPSNTGENLPMGLYIHSGGWYAGSVEFEEFYCRTIAEKCKMIVFSPDYRLAPENPYPAGLDDCCATYEYMHDSASKYGGDSSKKFIMGSSAAGNLTACLGVKYASSSDLRPSGLITACLASCDPKAMPEEYKKRHTPEKYTDAPMVGNEILQLARDWLNPASVDDPLYSPLLHPDIKLLPRTLVVACSKDPMHQESLFWYQELKKQGVEVELAEYIGWPHCFWLIPMLPKSVEFTNFWCEKLNAMVAAA